jgi:hypothetical protein
MPSTSLATLRITNLTTGAATLVGSDGQTDLFALGYDNATNSLFGASFEGDFGSVSMANGAFSLIGNNGITSEGLTFNTSTGQLILSDAANGYIVDPSTGNVTLLGSFGDQDDNGITYDPVTNEYWSFDDNGNLIKFNSSFQILNSTGLGVGLGASIAYVAGVPEPMSMTVLGLGVVAVLHRRSRK